MFYSLSICFPMGTINRPTHSYCFFFLSLTQVYVAVVAVMCVFLCPLAVVAVTCEFLCKVAVPCRFGLQFVESTVTETVSQSDGSFCQETTQSPTKHSCTTSSVSTAVVHTQIQIIYTTVQFEVFL